jgi:deazaflavin-dependent oxidoreductase (nitroreductase family)
MTARPANSPTTPWFVPVLNAPAKVLLKLGVPMGLNGLITIRGRASGIPRTTPVAFIEINGRRWVWCPWGEAHWVRNLRAAGEASVTIRKREETVRARELDEEERIAFFRDVMGPLARRIPFGLGVRFLRLVDGIDVNDPASAANGHPAFELLRVEEAEAGR